MSYFLCKSCGEVATTGEVCRTPRPNWRAERIARIRRATRIGTVDDRLSRAAAILVAHGRRQESIAEDLAVYFAPSECNAHAYAAEDEVLVEALAAIGWTPDALEAELRDRVSLRWIYYSGLTSDLRSLVGREED